jgi:hypothetical protein
VGVVRTIVVVSVVAIRRGAIRTTHAQNATAISNKPTTAATTAWLGLRGNVTKGLLEGRRRKDWMERHDGSGSGSNSFFKIALVLICVVLLSPTIVVVLLLVEPIKNQSLRNRKQIQFNRNPSVPPMMCLIGSLFLVPH